jgi:hypothetical protein
MLQIWVGREGWEGGQIVIPMSEALSFAESRRQKQSIRVGIYSSYWLYSSAAEEEIAKQFPTELWRVLKFSMYTSILHIVVIIPVFRGGTLFQTRIIIIHMCSLLI